MPIEPERVCGYRQVGGLYMVCPGKTYYCDRLPLRIPECPYCGEHPRFTRGIAKIYPKGLWGWHSGDDPRGCTDKKTCNVCYPGNKAYLMWMGKDYTLDALYNEAKKLGISKRIPRVPHDFEMGDEVWLAKKGYITDPNDKRVKYDAVVMTFVPTAIEYLAESKKKYTKKEETKMQELADQGVHIVYVKRTPENAVHFKKSKERKQKIQDKIKPLDFGEPE